MELALRMLAFYRMENPFESHSNDYWRLHLINIFLVAALFVYGFFTLFNLLITQLYANAIIDIVGLLTVNGIVLNFRRKKQLHETSHYVVISVFVLTASVIMLSEKHYGILFWSIFLPIFAMLLLGKTQGLYYSVVYYLILVAHLVSSLERGVTLHIIIEFVITSALLVTIIYYYEASRIQAYQQLERRTLLDPLTGLYNRRHFDELFNAEFNRLKRSGTPFAFFLMDVDNFKSYNDRYGHQRGDLALQSLGDILHAYLRRPGDVPFRLGGEEFGGILSCQESATGIHYVEQIRNAIQELEIEHQGNHAHGVITASFGFTLVTHYDGLTPERVYNMADDALYRAKRAGRNCTDAVSV